MKRLSFVANPIFLLMMIGSFVYVYFFYLADGPARKREAAEVETEIARPVAPQNSANATTPVAGIVMKEENPFNIGRDPGQMNVQSGGQFFDQQNRQNPLALREENLFRQRIQKPRLSRQPDPNSPVDPNGQQVQLLYPYGFAGQNVVPVAGGAIGKTWVEAHWIGLEVGPMTAAVAKANNIPPDVSGVLVDEVTLVSADAGLLAGDVITAINGMHLSDLLSFKNATRPVAMANQAEVTIYRRGSYKKINVRVPDELGIAQVEGAPMILATERAPHGYYGPCDKCHSIAPGTANLNQMARDLGDVLATKAPNIKKGTPPPHRPRGTCSKCHVLL
ncbi:MAG: PDZ domain-containing protein [Desulfuromonadales bacterium]